MQRKVRQKRRVGKRLSTLANVADQQGFHTYLSKPPVRVNPRTGHILRGRPRQRLYVFSQNGDVVITKDGNDPSGLLNSDVEGVLCGTTQSE